jgi:Fic family protein
MRQEEFQQGAPGQLIRGIDGRLTFVPSPLPPALDFLPTLTRRISEVDNLLGRLDGKAHALPDRRILVRSFVRREAQLSSYIENTFAGYAEIAEAGEAGRRAEVNEPVRETLNAERAINAGVQAVFDRGQPVTLALVKQMHGTLLDGVRGHDTRGHFRSVQVFIGKQYEDVAFARFVPAPPALVLDLMEQFERFLPGVDDLPSLVQLGLLHYQFETIHPFEDGKGRLGRILILLGLCQHKLLTVPLLNASLHFERNRQEYYDRLLRVSTDGDWRGWLSFFIEGLRVAASESMEKLSELTDLQAKYHERLRSARNSALLLKFLDNLFVRPVISVTDAASIMGVTYQSAQNSVQKLVDAKILTVIKNTSMPTRFVAKAILKSVNAEPTRR